MPITGQQSWWLFARDFDDPFSGSVTIQVKNRDTFAEVALFDVWVLDEEFHSTVVGISQIVSDSGVENLSPESNPSAFRKNVTSVTFKVHVINAHAAGRWMLYFWS